MSALCTQEVTGNDIARVINIFRFLTNSFNVEYFSKLYCRLRTIFLYPSICLFIFCDSWYYRESTRERVSILALLGQVYFSP
jgi:TctA family transporter